jgi:hypothetical protein
VTLAFVGAWSIASQFLAGAMRSRAANPLGPGVIGPANCAAAFANGPSRHKTFAAVAGMSLPAAPKGSAVTKLQIAFAVRSAAEGGQRHDAQNGDVL